jgi:hypothetical protein
MNTELKSRSILYHKRADDEPVYMQLESTTSGGGHPALTPDRQTAGSVCLPVLHNFQ